MKEVVTKKTTVTMRNRNRGTTCYTLSNGVRREFAPGQSRVIDIEELRELVMLPGGEFALKNYFIINDKDALSALEIETEPEYFYTEAEIKKLLQEGSLDQLEDCLNFAPEGVIEILKKMSVEMKLPDTEKRELISKMTGFSIDNAIRVNKIMNEEEKKETKSEKPVRKAKVVESTPTRKAEPVTESKYVKIDKK